MPLHKLHQTQPDLRGNQPARFELLPYRWRWLISIPASSSSIDSARQHSQFTRNSIVTGSLRTALVEIHHINPICNFYHPHPFNLCIAPSSRMGTLPVLRPPLRMNEPIRWMVYTEALSKRTDTRYKRTARASYGKHILSNEKRFSRLCRIPAYLHRL